MCGVAGIVRRDGETWIETERELGYEPDASWVERFLAARREPGGLA
jgi:hypothetical protein